MTEQATVERASTRTTLVLGEIEAPIGLFKVSRDSAAQRKWVKPPVTEEDAETVDALAGSIAASGGGKAKSKGKGGGGLSSGSASAPSGADGEAPAKPRKGILKADGDFVDLTDHIAAIAEQTTLDRLEVVSFIRREQVPRERILNGFYVGAGGGKAAKHSGAKVIGLLYRALKDRERAAVVRWGKRTKSSVGVMVPHRSGALVVLELAYAENMLAPSPDCLIHNHVDLPDSLVDAMGGLIDSMAESRGSLDDIHDRRAELEDELVVRAEHGELDDFEAEAYGADEEVAELAELMERSLATA